MHNDKHQFYFLLVAIVLISILVFFIFLPFAYSLVLAAVFAVIFKPLYENIHKYISGNDEISAIITVFAVLLIVLAPMLLFGVKISQEAYQLYTTLSIDSDSGAVINSINSFVVYLQNLLPIPQDFSIDISQYGKQVLGWLIQNINNVFSSFANFIIGAFIFLIALFFLFRDGEKLKNIIIKLSPLADRNDIAIIKKLELAINSVIRGSLVIALIQGFLSVVGLVIFGVPSAVLWGSLATVTALIPGVGTALVFIPATIFLLFSEQFLSALGLFLWGTIIVGLVDNLLRPHLVGKGMQLHPFIVFLSVIGGLGFFGPIGFLLGPLTLSLFFALIDIYSGLVQEC
ncbi:MAG: AI-2E family transporter [bacterium]